jgi:hypothetical protein
MLHDVITLCCLTYTDVSLAEGLIDGGTGERDRGGMGRVSPKRAGPVLSGRVSLGGGLPGRGCSAAPQHVDGPWRNLRKLTRLGEIKAASGVISPSKAGRERIPRQWWAGCWAGAGSR